MVRWPNGSATQPRISSAFGPRAAGAGSTNHKGCDFTGFSLVRAVASGRVHVTGTPSGWSAGGRQVWIQHDGFFSRSMHLASISVANGAYVNEGDVIGVMGMTGTASGIHLHLEIILGALHYGGGQIDPVAFIKARLTGTTAGAEYHGLSAAWWTEIQKKLVRLGYQIVVDGIPGPATMGAVRDFQSKNGLTVDGIAGPLTNAKMDERLTAPVGGNTIPDKRSTADIQRLVGAEPDGVYGPATTAKVMAWQQAHGLVADGVWGPASDAVGFPPVTGGVALDVDGILGHNTIVALQISLGLRGADVDGKMGPKTISALQLALGFVGPDVDGIMGPNTSKALQRTLGVTVDGAIGENTIKALQSLLNAGGKIVPVAGVPETPVPPATARTPIYPGAIRGWLVPLSSDRAVGAVVNRGINHHTTNPGDEEPYFKTQNSRGSCPTWYVKANGEVIELIAPGKKPSATGSANAYSFAIEIQNTTVAPNWETSEAALEAVAQIWAWVASFDGKTLDGAAVEFKLDRTHIIGHNEAGVNATACPGPFIQSRLGSIVVRAQAIYAEKYAPKPDPDPDPDPDPVDNVSIPRADYDALTASVSNAARILEGVES